jgi:hypothetical protein
MPGAVTFLLGLLLAVAGMVRGYQNLASERIWAVTLMVDLNADHVAESNGTECLTRNFLAVDLPCHWCYFLRGYRTKPVGHIWAVASTPLMNLML